MSIIFSSLFLIILTTNLYSIGFIFLNEKKNNLGLAPNILFGFTILILLSNFLFFIFYLNSLQIFYILFVLSTIISIYCFFKIKYFYLNKLKYLILFSLPIIFFYIFLATIYGEQYYVFRGNKWDWFALVTSSVYLNTINTHDFLELSKNFNWETVNNFETNQLSAYHQNIKIWLLRKVNLYLLGSLFQNLNFNSPFLNLYLLKIFSIILINFSIYDFFKKFLYSSNNKIIILSSLSFVFSFWILYISEADYYRHLISFSLFIYLITNLDNIFYEFNNNNTIKIVLISFISYSLFLIYPELLFIYLLLLILTFLFFEEKITFFKNNYIKLLLIILGFLIIVWPSYELIYIQTINQINSTSTEHRWWTYFGAFIFGKSSPAINIEFANEVKRLIYANPNQATADNLPLKDILFIIVKTISKFNLENVYFSILPSLSGFYFITDLFKFNNSFNFNIFFLIILNSYLIYHIAKNIIVLFKSRDKISKILKIIFLFFSLFSIFLILKGKLWTFIKFYMYLSPVIYLFILCKFSETNKKINFKLNYFLVLIMFTFPIYKFSQNNFGINKFDSFPNIQKEYMKKNIEWNFDRKKYDSCKKVILDFKKWDFYNTDSIPDRFKSIYLSVHLIKNGFTFINNKTLINSDSEKLQKICKVSNL